MLLDAAACSPCTEGYSVPLLRLCSSALENQSLLKCIATAASQMQERHCRNWICGPPLTASEVYLHVCMYHNLVLSSAAGFNFHFYPALSLTSADINRHIEIYQSICLSISLYATNFVCSEQDPSSRGVLGRCLLWLVGNPALHHACPLLNLLQELCSPVHNFEWVFVYFI